MAHYLDFPNTIAVNAAGGMVTYPAYTLPSTGVFTLSNRLSMDVAAQVANGLFRAWDFQGAAGITLQLRLATTGSGGLIIVTPSGNTFGFSFSGYPVDGTPFDLAATVNFDTGACDVLINGVSASPFTYGFISELRGVAFTSVTTSDNFNDHSGTNLYSANFNGERTYNPSDSAGTGLVLPDGISTNDGILSEGFATITANSQWIFYDDGSVGSGYYLELSSGEEVRFTSYTFPTTGVWNLTTLLGGVVGSGVDLFYPASFVAGSTIRPFVQLNNGSVGFSIVTASGFATYTSNAGVILTDGTPYTLSYNIDLDTGAFYVLVDGTEVVRETYAFIAEVRGFIDSSFALQNEFSATASLRLYNLNINGQHSYDSTDSAGVGLAYQDNIGVMNGTIQGAPDNDTQWIFYGTPVDPTLPVITLVGSASITQTVGGTYTDAGATASDTEDGNITGSIVVAGTVDPATVGVYTITYNVTDSAGNIATQETRTVTIAAVVTGNAYAVVYNGGGQVNTPSLGNVLSSVIKFGFENLYVDPAIAFGYLVGQGGSTPQTREIALRINNVDGSLSVWLGGTLTMILSAAEIAAQFGGTAITADLFEFEINASTGAYSISEDEIVFKTGTAVNGGLRADGFTFMIGARNNDDANPGNDYGANTLHVGATVGSTKITIDGTVVRHYVSTTNTGQIWTDIVGGFDGTMFGLATDTSQWQIYTSNDLGGGTGPTGTTVTISGIPDGLQNLFLVNQSNGIIAYNASVTFAGGSVSVVLNATIGDILKGFVDDGTTTTPIGGRVLVVV
jgi:hypothetical protein